MRIAQVAPLYESVPPRLYGGTERVVHYLTEELIRLGHEVTLFASGDSRTSARLQAACGRSLRLDPACVDPIAHHLVMIDRVLAAAGDFDVLHFHIDYLHFPASARQRVPSLTTLHGRLDLPDLVPLYRHFRALPVVSISDAQREPLPFVRWVATVYHGLPLHLLRQGDGAGGYLAFLGRASPEKGLEQAIAIARSAGMPLRVAAKVDAADRAYFESSVAPLLREPGVEFLGEIGEAEKQEFLGRARALLFPIDWPEPFGLVLVEAMACGTPVIAYPRGAVPEIMEPGVTGFLCRNVDEAVTAIGELDALDRTACRQAFERRFAAERMARDYLAAYDRVLAAGRAD
jgi:glycosyltransferase involved in cell wall biosynthesis